jgi:DNA-binding PadR family transcriptional regulator
MSNHLGEFEQLILLALLRLGDEAYGVAIRQEIAQRTERDVAAGAVYTALARLEGRELVTSRLADTTPSRGGRPRKYYRLTPVGAEALQRAVQQFRVMADGVLPRLDAIVDETAPEPEH